ncbi:MAG TPA: efflux transporter outer membrane subunit [Gammaproteobacteria bacterium]|nr:efflux transporter outer membrane subunit [Gammaproteobacteria bacterium]
MAVLLAGLSGCYLIPPYQRPSAPAPEHWRGGTAATPGNDAGVATDWWQHYGSNELNQSVQEALAQNKDLQAALHRIEQARASAKIAGAGLLPTVDASVNASRTYSDSGNHTPTQSDSYQGLLSVAYEVDLWRRNRSAVEAAEARTTSSTYDRDALALVVMTDTAQAYFQVLNLRERGKIARDNIATERDVLNIVETQYREGRASALEVAQQKTAVANVEAALTALERQEQVTEDGLAVLRGRAPADLSVTTDTLQDIALPAIAAGQPSTLLERRPDIRRAEQDLIAAHADIAVARAALFPTLNLGLDPTLFASPGTAAVALASSLTAPIFEGGRLRGEVERTEAREAELVETYRQIILTSFQEVEDALAAIKSAQQRVQSLTVAAEAARDAYQISRDRYLAGAIDFLTLLNTQTTQLQAEDALAQARLDQFAASVDLYKALGGGWQEH